MQVTETLASKLTQLSIVTANGVGIMAGDDILTAAGLEDLVFNGVTYGAWVKIALAISLGIIIILNVKKLYVEIFKPLWKAITKGLDE